MNAAVDLSIANPISLLIPRVLLDGMTGDLVGDDVVEDRRTLGQLVGVFANGEALGALDPFTLAYSVQCYFPVAPGTPGGLFFGVTHLRPGTVGDEFFMTKGHFHENRDSAEFYWGTNGEGILLLMGEDRSCRTERICAGSVHYVPGRVAHRVINTGCGILSFGACWPSDAGHDYESIRRDGFSARVFRGPKGPVVVSV